MKIDRRRLGASGEEAAARWYVAQGYEVLARNWRCPTGEIDLVVRRDRTVVFCEVKTRTSLAFGAPIEAVTPVKQRRLRSLGAQWLAAHRVRAAVVRYDVASVMNDVVEVCEAAF